MQEPNKIKNEYYKEFFLDKKIVDITALYSNCNKVGWDGENALPLNIITFPLMVKIFLVVLDLFPKIDFDAFPCPDGTVGFQWMVRNKQILTIEALENLEVLIIYINKEKEITVNKKVPFNEMRNILEGIKEKM